MFLLWLKLSATHILLPQQTYLNVIERKYKRQILMPDPIILGKNAPLYVKSRFSIYKTLISNWSHTHKIWHIFHHLVHYLIQSKRNGDFGDKKVDKKCLVVVTSCRFLQYQKDKKHRTLSRSRAAAKTFIDLHPGARGCCPAHRSSTILQLKWPSGEDQQGNKCNLFRTSLW